MVLELDEISHFTNNIRHVNLCVQNVCRQNQMDKLTNKWFMADKCGLGELTLHVKTCYACYRHQMKCEQWCVLCAPMIRYRYARAVCCLYMTFMLSMIAYCCGCMTVNGNDWTKHAIPLPLVGPHALLFVFHLTLIVQLGEKFERLATGVKNRRTSALFYPVFGSLGPLLLFFTTL